ncbi:MAG: hypothetical protein HC903_23240 [Methylacidiphilales bacterium]|nr:hypothetical protein [Candidatus Methylacidiphilales bacterium]
MTYDSAIPNQESNPNNSEPAEANSTALSEDINPVLPDEEVDSVLHFISSPIADNEKLEKSHFMSSSVMLENNDFKSLPVDNLSSDNLSSDNLSSDSLNLDTVAANSLPLENAEIVVESDTPAAVSNSLIFAESQKIESQESKYQQIGLPPASLKANAQESVSSKIIPDNTVQINQEKKSDSSVGNAVLLKITFIILFPFHLSKKKPKPKNPTLYLTSLITRKFQQKTILPKPLSRKQKLKRLH